MYSRSSEGSSVVELLIATTITGLLSLAFLGILLVNFKSNSKVTVMSSTMAAIRNLKERIGRDVREGRSLGDVYGTDFVNTYSYGGQTITDHITRGSDLFPSPNDPIYGSATPSCVQFPNNWGTKPYKLSNQCLIVQIPITDDHQDAGTTHALNSATCGWPTAIQKNEIAANVPSTPQDNVETHVYMVVADPSNPGQWLMQYASFPGYQAANSGYLQAAHNQGAANGTPQTILSGIVGPLDVNGNPKVFQFVDRTDATGTPRDSITPSADYAANYTGVVVNLEVQKTEGIKGKSNQSVPIGVKMEVFLRNNALATSTGKPQADW
jgi:hypothetical protein